MNESDKYQNKTATTPETVKNNNTTAKSSKASVNSFPPKISLQRHELQTANFRT